MSMLYPFGSVFSQELDCKKLLLDQFAWTEKQMEPGAGVGFECDMTTYFTKSEYPTQREHFKSFQNGKQKVYISRDMEIHENREMKLTVQHDIGELTIAGQLPNAFDKARISNLVNVQRYALEEADYACSQTENSTQIKVTFNEVGASFLNCQSASYTLLNDHPEILSANLFPIQIKGQIIKRIDLTLSINEVSNLFSEDEIEFLNHYSTKNEISALYPSYELTDIRNKR